MTATAIDLADVQGDILRAYGNDYTRTTYVFLHVADPQRGRAWLGGLLDEVTTATPWTGTKPDTALNVAVTCAGLDALGVAPHVVGSFSSEFRQGMAARAAELGDAGDAAPGHWDDGLGTGRAHVLVTINAKDDDCLTAALERMERGRDASITEVRRDDARLLGDEHGSREHFGFGDGFSQPSIEGVNEDKARGGGVLTDDGGWRPLAAGEFILGYPDEETRTDPERRLPSAPDGPLGRGGTYMVWRKLHQDVAAFRRTVRDAAARYPNGDPERLAAKIVGRWRNGAPLVRWPDAEPEHFDGRAPDANDFRYEVDHDGLRCPLGAHIRRTNPRDALGFDTKLTFRHRIIRRGMPYGPPLADGVTEADDTPRGLIFVCFNASISRQFESVQRQWVIDGNAFHLGDDPDFLLSHGGPPRHKMTVQGEPPQLIVPDGPLVTTKGGEYLFVPSMTGLAAIVDGVTG